MTVEAYNPGLRELWDSVVDSSRNGTFLLRRGYMDYHADRFADRSLLVRDGHGAVAALFAAADGPGADPGTITAHPGLTYGGLVLPPATCGGDALEILEAVAGYWRGQGRRRMVYRAIPHIYHRMPAEDDIYALFRLGARMTECSLSSAYEAPADPPRNQNTRRNIARGQRNGIVAAPSDSLDAFHAMLARNLDERHGAMPVHSADELRLLASRFPENIRLWTATGPDGTMLAGTLLFVTDTCAHAQYIASTPEGRELRAPAVLFDTVMEHYRPLRRYFDFGTSCEDHGRYLNAGLVSQKCRFGARGIAYTTYELEL